MNTKWREWTSFKFWKERECNLKDLKHWLKAEGFDVLEPQELKIIVLDSIQSNYSTHGSKDNYPTYELEENYASCGVEDVYTTYRIEDGNAPYKPKDGYWSNDNYLPYATKDGYLGPVLILDTTGASLFHFYSEWFDKNSSFYIDFILRNLHILYIWVLIKHSWHLYFSPSGVKKLFKFIQKDSYSTLIYNIHNCWFILQY